ncbi:DNA-binding LacI/PurR family transcriptional regulator [Thermocatellispora tengchongensis]|uniref:DNA-binding LacI/PurR family transcriptional regulator n=1 Tax=Thermocatellispora tengchongensis TaxID=1073253 RepID=A0A840PHT0_9ACTN|nr:LacI family DNA-binding transcriptional regulator [Thermocatellispora tengchongensis]MBB5138529.1 DNA-binding LacI/PurR family transcriptional regulator [Thermocatellispora tengchongensis]
MTTSQARAGSGEATGTRGRRPGIKDVAGAAGVSVTTVSHVLNGKGRVDAATRARVAEAAERLGYRPNSNARGLRSGRTDTIAMLLPAGADAHDHHVLAVDYYLSLTMKTVEAAFERDQALLQLPPLRRLDDLRRFGIDGGIVLDPVPGDGRVAMFHRLGLPVVTVGRDITRPDDPWWVAADSAASTRTVLEHFAAGGARRVAMLSVDIEWSWFADAERTYVEWAAERGCEPILVLARPDRRDSSAASAAAALLDLRPDAVYVPPQWLATGLLRLARDRGVRVPDDLLVAVGVDSHLARTSEPALTAVDLDPARTAREAVDLLMHRIEGGPPGDPRVIPVTLHPRGSSLRPK